MDKCIHPSHAIHWASGSEPT